MFQSFSVHCKHKFYESMITQGWQMAKENMEHLSPFQNQLLPQINELVMP